MNIQLILDFLKDLAAHNNREWFMEHKAMYQAATAEFDKLLLVLIARISQFDPSVKHLQPKDWMDIVIQQFGIIQRLLHNSCY